MADRCNYCGMSYNRFRAPDQIEFSEAYAVQFKRAKAFAAAGDYSKPATRAAVLGKMREWKLEAWNEHQFVCGETAALEVLYDVDQDDLAARGKWVELDAVQDAIREIERSLGIESVPF
jgi:hypothetical protein